MRSKFTQSFKVQAVEKTIQRPAGVSVREMAASLQVGHSTLAKWLASANVTECKCDSHEAE